MQKSLYKTSFFVGYKFNKSINNTCVLHYKYRACHCSSVFIGDIIIRPQWFLSLSDAKILGPSRARPTVLLLLILQRPTTVSTRLVWLSCWRETSNESVALKTGCLSPSVAEVRFVLILFPEQISVTLTKYSTPK